MSLAKFIQTLGIIGVVAALAVSSRAQQYPSKPIRIVIGFPAGSATDAIARLYGQKMSEILGAPVIVDNKPGASQLVAIATLQAAPPDGYTLFLGTGSSLAQGPGVRTDLPYDPLKDFSLVGSISTSPGAITVHPSLPVHTIRDLINFAKANPDRLSYSSAGFGSAGHLDGEYFMYLTGTKMVHVPYKADSEAMREVAAGTVQVGMTTVQFVISLFQSGKVRPLAAIATRRLASLPNVPTVAEVDIKGLEGMVPYTFYGLVGPSGLPPAVANQLSDALATVGAMPDVVSRLQEVSYGEPMTGTPAAFRGFLQKQIAKWRELGKSVTLTY